MTLPNRVLGDGLRLIWLDDSLRLALIKESSAYRAFWEKDGGEKALKAYFQLFATLSLDHLSEQEAELASRVSEGLDVFGIWVEASDKYSFGSLFRALNPFNDELPDPLPIHFDGKKRPVSQIKVSGHHDEPLEHFRVTPRSRLDKLRPSERLFIIDISCKKEAILNDLSRYLDHVAYLRKNSDGKPWKNNYEQWQPDAYRLRKEAWTHLKVWRLRRQRKSFIQISQEIGMKIDAAKKAFARAYELIEGRRYDPKRSKKLCNEIQASELKRTCATCPDNPDRGGDCTPETLCPDVLAYIEQDQVRLSEQLTQTGGAAERLLPKIRTRTCSPSD